MSDDHSLQPAMTAVTLGRFPVVNQQSSSVSSCIIVGATPPPPQRGRGRLHNRRGSSMGGGSVSSGGASSGGVVGAGAFKSVLDFNALPLSGCETAPSANPLATPRTSMRQSKPCAATDLAQATLQESDGLIDMSAQFEVEESCDEDALLASRASSAASVVSRSSRRSDGERSVTFESHVVRLGSQPPPQSAGASGGSQGKSGSSGSARATRRRRLSNTSNKNHQARSWSDPPLRLPALAIYHGAETGANTSVSSGGLVGGRDLSDASASSVLTEDCPMTTSYHALDLLYLFIYLFIYDAANP
ncbi:Hypothetical protein, putative [Bodo saltans]|uniref:Uncharacterized protein n=1 Tax=Bodo saltans TaxID=75058 RepID=A0A0S4KK71_BODSA|nr:Hypothetical protein, putative [Bodo saltans]|eukprot:CUI14792.1 Hypothetical protein, putative [Bodo saltans]